MSCDSLIFGHQSRIRLQLIEAPENQSRVVHHIAIDLRNRHLAGHWIELRKLPYTHMFLMGIRKLLVVGSSEKLDHERRYRRPEYFDVGDVSIPNSARPIAAFASIFANRFSVPLTGG